MASTYVNDLRLEEMATGDQSGTWGDTTNTNLELIAEAFSYGTQASFGSDADATTTIADGASDPARSLYLKITSGVSLTATRTLTIAPNTVSKIWIIENATSGSQSINISQGSGANVTIPNGDVKVVYSDGAGSGAAIVDAFINLKVTDPAQTNITSVGALDGGSITSGFGAIDTGSSNITTTGTVSGSTLTGTLSTAAQTNITSVGALDGGSITSGFGSIDVGSSAITTTGTVTGNTLTGTLSTAAQPNITSLGTLTALTGGTGDLNWDSGTLFVDSSANAVGIGTTSPSFKTDLNVNSTSASDTQVALRIKSTTTANMTDGFGVTQLFSVQDSSGSNFNIAQLRAVRDGADDSGAFVFAPYTTGTASERMRIDTSGNVGIGTTSPSGKIQANAADSQVAVMAGGDVSDPLYPAFGFDGQIGSNGGRGAGMYLPADGTLAWSTAGSEAMRIDSSGNVGIGTSSPSNILKIFNTANSDGVNVENTNASFSESGLFVNNTASTGGNLLRLRSSGSNKVVVLGTGNVGIGTDSPAESLHTTGNIRFGDTAPAELYTNSSELRLGVDKNNDNDTSNITFYTNNDEKVRIDADGNVGIGTDSPKGLFSVYTGGGAAAFTSEGISTSAAAGVDVSSIDFINRRSNANTIKANIKHITDGTANGSALTFGTTTGAGATERMRIDSDGNVLIGKTALDNTTVGVRMNSTGDASFVADDNRALVLNRKTSDGDIAIFLKDGLTVGSIGTSGNDLIAGTGDTGLYFYDGADTVIPWNISTNSARNGSIDLGASSHRFKDLYLSGGAYLGGTGSANKLDDYEEGTWTPVLTAVSGTKTWSYSAAAGYYTKVGNVVTVWFNIQLSSDGSGTDGNARITGLPFTHANATDLVAVYGHFWKQLLETSDVALQGRVPVNQSYIELQDGSANYPDISPINTSVFVNDRRVRGTIQYRF